MNVFLLLASTLIVVFAPVWVIGVKAGHRGNEHKRLTWSSNHVDAQIIQALHVTDTSTVMNRRSRFPTLALIEQGLNYSPGTLTHTPDAIGLEQRASALVSEYMSEFGLLTGLVPKRIFDRIIAESPQIHLARLSDPNPVTDLPVVPSSLGTDIVPAA